MSESGNQVDPSYDPIVRRRVQKALDEVIFAARDVVMRYSRDGVYEAPDPVPFGDVTGLIEAGRNQVVDKLQERLDTARAIMLEVYLELDRHKSELYGPSYRAPTRDISGRVTYEREPERTDP